MHQHHLMRAKALTEEKRSAFAGQLQSWLKEHRANNGEAKRLRVFYVPRRSMSPSDLRAFLSDHLPSYLVPSEYVPLQSLPTTTNGKLDRVALQSLPAAGSALENFLPSPDVRHGEHEERVAEIWSRILGVSGIGPNSNFFELGGHSLLATQVIMEIERTLGIEIPLGAIFKYSTVAQLAEHLASLPTKARRSTRNTLKPAAAAPFATAPLSTSQRRLWYASQLSEQGLEYKLVKVIDINGPLNTCALTQSIAEIINRHETLRTCFGYISGDLVQKINPPATFCVEYVDFSDLSSQAIQSAFLTIQDEVLHRTFDLEKEPGIRMTLLRCSPAHTRLLVDLHHIVVDGWSVGLLVRELNALFRNFSVGEPSSLDPLPIQFRDAVAHEKGHLSEKRIDEQLSYWRAQLADLQPIEFLSARPTGERNGQDGEVEVNLGRDVSAAITRACNRLCITPFMFLVSVYHLMLQLHSRAIDIPIATDVANREARDQASLIGFFVNQVVLRIPVTPALTFAQLCARTRATVTDAFANKDLPFEMVLRETAPRPHVTQSPLTRAMFSFHHCLPDLSMPGLEVRLIDVRPPITKYCLLLNMEEGTNGLCGSIEYSGSIFDRQTVERMTADFTALCHYSSADIEAPLSTLRDAVLSASHERDGISPHKDHTRRRRDLNQFLATRLSAQPVVNENR